MVQLGGGCDAYCCFIALVGQLEYKLLWHGPVSRPRLGCSECCVAMQARLKNPKNEDLWLAAIRLEQRAKNGKAADAAMAKALQECPASGQLWAEAVAMAPRPARRARSVDALKRCNDDPHIIAAIAQLAWHDREVRAGLVGD